MGQDRKRPDRSITVRTGAVSRTDHVVERWARVTLGTKKSILALFTLTREVGAWFLALVSVETYAKTALGTTCYRPRASLTYSAKDFVELAV